MGSSRRGPAASFSCQQIDNMNASAGRTRLTHVLIRRDRQWCRALHHIPCYGTTEKKTMHSASKRGRASGADKCCHQCRTSLTARPSRGRIFQRAEVRVLLCRTRNVPADCIGDRLTDEINQSYPTLFSPLRSAIEAPEKQKEIGFEPPAIQTRGPPWTLCPCRPQ